MGELDRATELRHTVLQYFMLPEPMWTEWIDDCANYFQSQNIAELFEKAFADYLYPSLSLKFLTQATEPSERAEEIVSVYGSTDDQIWRAYTQLNDAQQQRERPKLPSNHSQFESDYQHCLRQMTENEDIAPMLEHLGKLKSFKNYHYTRLYFEQLLPQFTLNPDLWQLYIGLTVEQSPHHVFSVHTRALKNLYHSADIWCSYALCQEQRAVEPHFVIKLLTEQAITQAEDMFAV